MVNLVPIAVCLEAPTAHPGRAARVKAGRNSEVGGGSRISGNWRGLLHLSNVGKTSSCHNGKLRGGFRAKSTKLLAAENRDQHFFSRDQDFVASTSRPVLRRNLRQ